jgi:hypothetical protein
MTSLITDDFLNSQLALDFSIPSGVTDVSADLMDLCLSTSHGYVLMVRASDTYWTIFIHMHQWFIGALFA